MKIYDHWAKRACKGKSPDGDDWWLVSWGGSNIDVNSAAIAAENNLGDLQKRLADADTRNSFYYCGTAPVKEKVLERFGNPDQPYAAITRNRYGALVLNAANVFIADVDLDLNHSDRSGISTAAKQISSKTEKRGFFSNLFSGKTKGPTRARQSAMEKSVQENYQQLRDMEQQRALKRFAEFHEKFPALSFRVYETAAGYRIIVTNQRVDTDDSQSAAWLEALESDKLYRRLCKQQQCYRARLTPKPWRLPGCGSPVFFPNGQYDHETGLENWIDEYREKSKSVAVCNLVNSYGEATATGETAEVLAVHDRYVLNDAVSALA